MPGSPSRIAQSFLFLHPARVFFGFENLVGICNAVGGGCLRVLECVIDAEFLIFTQCECVVGQYFDAFDVAECADEVSRACESFIVIADAWHKHMADPDGLLDAVEVAEELDDVLVAVACEVLMHVFVNVFDIDKQKVG